ncbi:MAG: hypothetical protein SNJ74_01795 [Fimbriimonadaceae bacterium]
MTAHELLAIQIEDAGYQIMQAVSGLDEAGMDYRPTPAGLTPRETLVHLTEAYVALGKTLKGEKHEWGSYSMPDSSTSKVLETWLQVREETVKLAMERTEAADLSQVHAFVIAHDYYHVGQLVQTRLAHDPSWDSYTIYRF